MESRKRTLVKTLTYRTIGIGVTTSVAWILTGQPVAALGIGAGDLLLKLAVYYAHERVWARIHFGRVRPPEYNI
jgi:uncharacterized membrane protein